MRHNGTVLLIICISLLFTVSCSRKTGTNLTGDLDIDRDTLLIKTMLMNNKDGNTDTILLKDGHFETRISDSIPVWLKICAKPRTEEDARNNYVARLLMLPGDDIHISGRLEDLQISKSELYDSLNNTEYYRLYCENYSLDRQIAQVYRNIKDETRSLLDSLLDRSQDLNRRMNDEGMRLVKKEPGNIASGFATITLPEKSCIEASEILDSSVTNGPLKELIKNNVEAKRKLLKKQEAWDNIKPGMPAPDFKLKDINGKTKSLSSFKGKYLVIEFWGSWCPWCIKGLPVMRTYYAKYKSKVEFVSINCRDTDEAWRRCVEKYDMKWTQLFNGDDKELTKKYGVFGFPSKFIIDANGKIVEKYLDEEHTFYEKLDEMFGK